MNDLKHIDEFQEILKSYVPSPEAHRILANTRLVLLVGPSSSGRNTIITELSKSGKYHFIVSDTTRKKRSNNGVMEENGNQYWFRSEKDILADLRAGEFLEAAIIHNQQVSGMSIREVRVAAREHKIAINEIEVTGAENVYTAKPDTLFFFVIPPSFEEWMMRMRSRGELPRNEIERRLTSAVNEINTALSKKYYQFIVNDTFMHTAREVESIITGHTEDTDQQAAARKIAVQLHKDTSVYLAAMN